MNKINELWMMHQTMQRMNDEEAYMSWISVGIPDGTESEEECEDCEEFYDEIESSFKRILHNHYKYGLYRPGPEVLAFARKYEPKIKEVQ